MLVHRRGRARSGARHRDARRSTPDHRLLWAACERAGHPLGGAERGGARRGDLSQTDPNAAARANARSMQRVSTNLDVPAGTQTIEDIEAELAGAQGALATPPIAITQTNNTLADLLGQIEGVPTEEVGAEILALQTRLQASLQTTAMLYKMSLVNYV